ncbi:TPA: YqaJ viral recombinase family protein, partial [Listeria monocytogenes]|nr:YqaJ viral recombinase family protein [Listeria monocytogenes]
MAIAKEKTMNILASVKDMNRTQWLLTRRLGIGGSDAGIIMGLNQYKTAFELWLDKTDQVLPDESAGEAAYWGNQMEEVVAKEFEKRTGKKVRRSNMMYQHPEHDFMLANVDRFVVGEDAILECKTASAYLAKEWEADEVPATYLVQIQHYLAVTGKSKAYVAVLIGGNKFIWKEIKRDDELINQIIAFELDFWETNVKGYVAPALDGSSAAEKYLKDRFAKSEAKQVILSKKYNEFLAE